VDKTNSIINNNAACCQFSTYTFTPENFAAEKKAAPVFETLGMPDKLLDAFVGIMQSENNEF